MLTRLDKDGKRVSEKYQDILEMENNINLALVQNIRDTEGVNHLEPEEDEEEKETEVLEMEKKRKTTFTDLKKRAITGFNKNMNEITYVSRKTFMNGQAVFAEIPSLEKLIKINQKNMKEAVTKKRKTTLGSNGFKVLPGMDFRDMNDLNDELELVEDRKQEKEKTQKNIEVEEVKETKLTEELNLDTSAINSEAHSELNQSLLKLKDTENNINKEKNEIIDYIINNREVTNDAVRSAEINVILYKNLALEPFSKLNVYRKILFLLNTPISILTYITVLPTTEEGYTKYRYLLNPFFGSLFLYFIITYLKLQNLYIFALVLVFGLLVSFLFSFVLINDRAPTGKLKDFFMFLGFITSFCWLFFLSDILVSVIETLNVLFNYQYSFMMVSSFSFWTWVPMALGSIRIVALLKEMPSFSGIMFNTYFVFGVAVLVQTLLYGNLDVKMWPSYKIPTANNLFYFLCLNAVVLIGFWIMLGVSGMRYNRVMGLVLVLGYLLIVFGVFVRGIFADN